MFTLPATKRLLIVGIGALLFPTVIFAILFAGREAQAANPSGDLKIEIFTAYNLIVDSNVESPSTYAPEAFHIGAQICNEGSNTMSGVSAYIGDYVDGSNDLPGVYPSRTHTGLTGTFSLTHLGGSAGTADAVRYIGDLAAGECRVQYWFVGYPRLDDNGNSVTQGIKPDDDLWLQYDLWATALDGATPLTAETTRTLYMRNEISAMANKISPNTTSKVPNEFLAVIDDLGWSSPEVETNQQIFPGQTLVMEGVWYDLGNVNKGFDNDGDFLPDYNAWLQPVGDPNTYDAGCFRLVQTDAVVVVKKTDGSMHVRTATNQLYFANLPEKNNGAVGLVYYTFAATNGACSSSLTPYQEVASGRDNEKFSGDYGAPLPSFSSQPSQVVLEKNVDQTTLSGALPQNLIYTMNFTNTGTTAVGDPALGIPLVVQDAVPAGTTYVAGSAALNNVLPTGVTAYVILYSDDNGLSWTPTEPAAASVTDVQWRLDAALPAGSTGQVTFEVTVPTNYPTPIVDNTAVLRFGSADPFAEDSAATLVPGPNSLGDTVWSDDGSGSGIGGDGVQNGAEGGLTAIDLTLYFDKNGDGLLDAGDIPLATTTSQSGSGSYAFNNLPDGRYLVAVNTVDGDLPTGFVPTTATTIAVDLDAAHGTTAPVSDLDADFGFSPVLQLSKTLFSASPLYEGDLITYTIAVTNLLYPDPPVLQSAYYASAGVAGTLFLGGGTSADLIGAPDGTSYISNDASPNATISEAEAAFGTGYTTTGCGTITKVEAVYTIDFSGFNDDNLKFLVFDNASTELFNSGALDVKADLDIYGTPNDGNSDGYQQIRIDITSGIGLTNWSTWDNVPANEIKVGLGVEKDAANDPFTLNFDAVGIEFTVDDATCALPDNSYDPDTAVNPLPLADTYDPAQLQFVTASIAPNGTTPAGTLTWNNIGPLNVGLTKMVTVTFKALEPLDNTAETITNTASVTGAALGNGLPVNNASDSAVAELRPTGSIGDFVWRDQNGDQSQSGEPGIPGVTVSLTPPAGVDLGAGAGVAITTTTDSSGFYLFEGLRNSGDYVVTVDTATLPVGSGSFTNTFDEDGNQNNQTTVTLDHDATDGSDEHTTADFGYQVPTLIDGLIWDDANQSATSTADGGENPLANVSVSLTGTGCTPCTTTTDANGYFAFVGNYSGSYTVVVDSNSGPLGSGTWTQSYDSDGTGTLHTAAVSVTSGGTAHVDYSYYQTGTLSLGDTIYYDWDGDGSQDPADEGIPNITVFLYQDDNGDGVIDAADALITTTTTNSSGVYTFNNLPAGNYIVQVDESDSDFPALFNPTQDPDESGICAVCDGQGQVALTVVTDTIDFGYDPVGSGRIGDTVFRDTNGDGTQSGVAETGIVSITVSLQADLNGDGTFVTVMTTTTDSSGSYLFEGLPDGDFRVVVDQNDSDLPADSFGNTYVPTTLVTQSATISGGSVTVHNGSGCTGCDLNSDFGFVNLGSIGDTVFWDANNNGTQDWNEIGIDNIVLTLTNAATQTVVIDGISYAPGAVISTTTTADGSGSEPAGFYRFAGLPPGSFAVTVDKTGTLNGVAQTSDPDRDGESCASTTYPSLPGCDDATTVTLNYGTNFSGADFGYQPSGVVGDFVFFDQDGDGLQGANELGISDIVVTATLGATVYTTTTDADGRYTFQGLTTGLWTIDVQQPLNMTPTASSGNDLAVNGNGSVGSTSTQVTIDGSGSVSAINGTACSNCDLNTDFGFELNGQFTVGGSICLENVSDGGCDVADTPVMTQTVYIYNSSNQLIGSTVSDASGVYTFTNLIADNYFVVVGTESTLLTNTQLTTSVGNSPANGSGVNENQSPVTGITETVSSAYQLVSINGTTAGGDDAVIEVDFAFVSTVNYDFGDLPASYSTTLAGSPAGPRHIIPATPTLYLGSAPDSEADATPGATADGDGADEDGVRVVASWANGTNGGQVVADVVGSGWLVGWVDFNRDGDFYDSGEMVINQAVSTGLNQPFTFDVPAGTFSGTPGALYSRFRLFESRPAFSEVAFAGDTNNGEVEDYAFNFGPTAVTLNHVASGVDPAAASKIWYFLLGLFTLTAIAWREWYKLR